MTENRRIFWNVIATYGRSLFALVCGLFTSRWVLMSLGQVDFGLYGVIGGLMVFITFFNSLLAGAVSRFYAFSVGAARNGIERTGIEECRKWFNTAVTIHSIVPFVLILVGYPIGVWAIENWLTIPSNRVNDCLWVFRFSCLSCFVAMFNVPFHAMYTAKQYIAELTIYSFATTALNFCFVYYMVSHPGIWLWRWALWSCILSIVPQMLICARAIMVFPECKLKPRYMGNMKYIRKIGGYAGWQLLGCFCSLLRSHGVTILINKFFGPKVNSAMAIANTVNVQSSTLSSSLLGAFSPAITNACGANERSRMFRLAYAAGKFGVLLTLLFVIPLALELPYVLRVWLKEPPAFAIGLCYCMIVFHIVDVCTNGHMVAINANGRIAEYQKVLSLVSIFTLPVAAICLYMGGSPYWVGYTLVVAIAFNSLGRVLFARWLLGMSVRYWAFKVVAPLLLLTVFCSVLGWLPRLIWTEGFVRLLLTVLIVEPVFVVLAWKVVLDHDERIFIGQRICRKFVGLQPLVARIV